MNVDLYHFPYCFDFYERILPLLRITFIISCMSLLNSKHASFLIPLKWIQFHNHKSLRYRIQLTVDMNRKKNVPQRHIGLVFPEFNTLFNNEYAITYLNILRKYDDTSILSELGDISKYPNAGKLSKFAGANTYISESGEFTADKIAITKKKYKYLRTTLYRVVIRHNPIFNNYYHLKRTKAKDTFAR